MQLLTPVDITKSSWSIGYADRILMLGSCFSDHIAGCLRERFFYVNSNPEGTLYNPVSIAHHMTDSLLMGYDVVLITFGTAWVYIDKGLAADHLAYDLSAVVDNCRKRPATDFMRYRLTVEDIVSLWRPILERFPGKRFVFTVSPIRHKKDGLHANQLSKAILLEAVDLLCQTAPSQACVEYFPSYEILLDELRDYRFYADDLVHPSSMAIQYIWERFRDTFFYNAATISAMDELHRYWLLTQHRPLHPGSAEAQALEQQKQSRLHALQSKYPFAALPE